MKITGIDFVTLPVRNPETSLNFYAALPGATVIDNRVAFGNNRIEFREGAVPPAHPLWTGALFRLGAEGAVREFLDFLQQRGIAVCAGPVLRDELHGAPGAGVVFRDPDEYPVEVVLRDCLHRPEPVSFQIAVAPQELATVALLACEIWPGVYSGIISPGQIEYMLRQMYDPARMESEIRNGCEFILVRKGEVAAGFSSYGPVDPATGDCEIHKIYLCPGSQRQGLGARIIDHACGWARAHGARRVTLHVNKNNAAAIRAYLHYGMKSVASVTNDIGGGFIMDDYIMARDV